MQSRGASPGGPAISSAKKRRLAALEKNFAQSSTGANKDQRNSTGSNQHKQLRPAPELAVPTDSPSSEFPYTALDPSSDCVAAFRGLQFARRQVQQPPAADPSKNVLDFILRKVSGGVTAAQTALQLRAQDKTVLLDNPMAQLSAGQAFKRQVQQKYSSKLLSKRKRRKLMSETIKFVTYSIAQQLHELWKGYITNVLANSTVTTSNDNREELLLLQADYHGAGVTVALAKNPVYMGVSGFIYMVTSSSFHIIAPDDKAHGGILPPLTCSSVGLASLYIAGLHESRELGAKREPVAKPVISRVLLQTSQPTVRFHEQHRKRFEFSQSG